MPEYTEKCGVADSGFSPFLRTQTKFEYTRPIRSGSRPASRANRCTFSQSPRTISGVADECGTHVSAYFATRRSTGSMRSEEHTSELQSQSNLVCRLLLEK